MESKYLNPTKGIIYNMHIFQMVKLDKGDLINENIGLIVLPQAQCTQPQSPMCSYSRTVPIAAAGFVLVLGDGLSSVTNL